MTKKQMNELADLVASKIVLELFGDAESRASAQEQFEKDFSPTDHLAGIFADMTDEEMHGIYLNEKVKASVLLSHGEGFGLPAFESAYMGIPVVATAWSGQLDFLCDENGKSHFYEVSYDIQQIPKEVVWESVLVAESMWAYPRESSAKEQMRQCYQDLTSKDYDSSKYCEYSQALKERFGEQKMYKKFVDAITPMISSTTSTANNNAKVVEID